MLLVGSMKYPQTTPWGGDEQRSSEKSERQGIVGLME